MRRLWPEFLVLALFLLADLLLEGLAAAAAGLAAGFAAFGVLLLTGRKKPGLIVEGVLFGAISAAGELIDFPGGRLILMELILGCALLTSVLFRRNLLKGMTAGLGGSLLAGERGRTLSLILGGLFCTHGAVYVILEKLGAADTLMGAVLFAALYITAIRLFSSLSKKADRKELPLLVRSEGRTVLIHNGETLGHMLMEKGPSGTATVFEPVPAVAPERFLDRLEECLGGLGYSSLVLSGWRGEDIELEISGFSRSGDGWRKPLRRRSMRVRG
jgi:hypothetical protein